jgi:hypothetical protein
MKAREKRLAGGMEMNDNRVLRVQVNTIDLLSADELRQYPGSNLTREEFDNHILLALTGEKTRFFYIRDGASQDRGPVELGVDEAWDEDPSDFDFASHNAEHHLTEMLKRLVRFEIEEELSNLSDLRKS